MKKRLLTVLLGLVLVLAACNGSANQNQDTGNGDESTTQSTGQLETSTTDGAGAGDAIVINFGHGGSEETAQQVGALAFKESLEKATDNKVTVNVYPNNSVGNDRELVESVQANTLEMCLANSVQMNFIEDATVYDTYFRFENMDEVIAKFRKDEDFFNTISKSYDDAGFHLAGFSVHGFRQLTANKEIRKPEDLAGIVFRTQENEYHMQAWKDIGANATPFAFNELYTALQQGTVDAQENPIELIYSQKFYEQQKFIIKTNHQQQVQTWLMSKQLYDSFDDATKEAFNTAIQVGCDAAQEYALSMEEQWEKEIVDTGVTVIDLSTDELEQFRVGVANQWESIKSVVSPEVWEAYMN